jgi:adenosylcobalamin-dependent ribonucleoside-triphosphate reductase
VVLVDLDRQENKKKWMINICRILLINKKNCITHIILLCNQKKNMLKKYLLFNNSKTTHNKSSLFDSLNKFFHLSKEFVDQYREKQAPFGFNGLGEVVYRRTYSRLKNDGSNKHEEWSDTLERVVNGTYAIQKDWINKHDLGWNELKAQDSAKEMFNRFFEMKCLPPGRGLWAMGSPITEKKGLFAPLNNCGFVSTDTMSEDVTKPFRFMMDMLMLGVGVGFDCKGADKKILVYGYNKSKISETVVIEDSREGWVSSVGLLINNLVHGRHILKFDYSKIRPAGDLIKGFGGTSSGSDALRQLHESISLVLHKNIGQYITITTIADIMNMIGVAVVAGNVKRTAEIAFGDPMSDEYINLKNYNINSHRSKYGWTSNNSVFAEIGMDYTKLCDNVVLNGEPGFAWLDNMRNYSRMNSKPDYKDHRASGGNPCLEQTLESYELCCLVETFPDKHEDLDDFLKTLKYAYLYAKTVTLCKTHWPETNRVMLRNRRIGCSMSGIAQFISKRGHDELIRWCEAGYDEIQRLDKIYSDWFSVPRSIKTTCIKPSGTVSLLAGATPGMHYPISMHYKRRVRFQKGSDFIQPLIDAGYDVEQSVTDDNSMIVTFPIELISSDNNYKIRSENELSMWEQLHLAALLQRHWADNQVSCTVKFNVHKESHDIKHALQYFQYKLKGISFLPYSDNDKTPYAQMPYETITKAEYDIMMSKLKTIKWSKLEESDPSEDLYCNNDTCVIPIGINPKQ